MTCPCCHAEERLGVRLPALKARIFDSIKAAGDLGVSRYELLYQVYADRRQPAPATIKAHVQQINDLLLETDFQIKADGRRLARYYLIKQRAPK
jgi:hypothetical protein